MLTSRTEDKHLPPKLKTIVFDSVLEWRGSDALEDVVEDAGHGGCRRVKAEECTPGTRELGVTVTSSVTIGEFDPSSVDPISDIRPKWRRL